MNIIKKLTDRLRKKIKKGFSLIEIVTVLGIMSVTSVLSMSFWQYYQPALKLEGETRKLTSDLRLTLSEALTTQTRHCLRFNLEQHLYQVIKTPLGRPEVVVKTTRLDNLISIAEITLPEVCYTADGMPSAAGRIVYSNNIKNTAVEVRPSGYVKIIRNVIIPFGFFN